jgi:3-mercaptopyruvate sulfurtransferase SseA
MRGHGIDSVYVLAGGLSAWEAMKFPVSLDFATPEKELARLGIEVHPPWNTTDSASTPKL